MQLAKTLAAGPGQVQNTLLFNIRRKTVRWVMMGDENLPKGIDLLSGSDSIHLLSGSATLKFRQNSVKLQLCSDIFQLESNSGRILSDDNQIWPKFC